jgi:hypothetical protein
VEAENAVATAMPNSTFTFMSCSPIIQSVQEGRLATSPGVSRIRLGLRIK